jgi:hypothetical protein
MSIWCNWKFEHVMLVYMFVWAVVLVATYMLAQ